MTLFQFYKQFDTEQKCVDYLIEIRWGGKITCPHCGHNRHYIISNDKRSQKNKNKDKPLSEFKCANNKCYKKFSAKTGTIFQASNVPLWQFFYLIYSSAVNKKNISSYQNYVNLGIAQKTCWYIMARIRKLCWQDQNLKLNGVVEVDETFLRRAKWKSRILSGDSQSRKYPVLGLLQRDGKVVVKVIPNKEKRIVQDIILKHVEVDSKLYTDSAPCYFGLSSYYRHESVNHREYEYARGEVSTNGIECFWAHFKKAVIGTHHGVSQLHLQGYCDEVAYRFNNRNLSPEEKFNDLMKRACEIGVCGERKLNLGVKKNTKKTFESKYKIVDMATGQVYANTSDAAHEVGFSKSHLYGMLRGEHPNKTTLKIVRDF